MLRCLSSVSRSFSMDVEEAEVVHAQIPDPGVKDACPHMLFSELFALSLPFGAVGMMRTETKSNSDRAIRNRDALGISHWPGSDVLREKLEPATHLDKPSNRGIRMDPPTRVNGLELIDMATACRPPVRP